MSDSRVSFSAATLALDMKAFGAVHHLKMGEISDVTLKLSAHDGDLGSYLEVKLTVAAPLSMRCEGNKYSSFSRLYAGAITSHSLSLITEDTYGEIPDEIRHTNRFKTTALGDAKDKHPEGKHPGVYKFAIGYDPEHSTHENLFCIRKFAEYIDPLTDKPLGDKPHIQEAFDGLRGVFAQPGNIIFYVRNEEVDFADEIDRLMSTQEAEIETGPIILQFYQEGQSKRADGSSRVPYLQVGQQKAVADRPNITTRKTYVHRDFTDFATRKGFATIQSMEYEKAEVQTFNNTPARAKFLSITGSGNQKYLAILYIDYEVGKRLQPGNIVYINFSLRIKERITNCDWKTLVIDRLPWTKPGEVVGITSRPHELHPIHFTEYQKKAPHEFAKGALTRGNSTVATDEMLREELKKLPFTKVSLRLEISNQTHQRRITAMNILQQASKISTTLAGVKAPRIHRPQLVNWQHRLCNSNQIPSSYTNILGGAEAYLTHLTANDHVDVKVLIHGRAGVGKTFVIAAVTTAMVRADPSKKVLVLAPSNEPCNVVARKLWEEMQRYPETRGKIVMRAHNTFTEKNYVVAFAQIRAIKAQKEAEKSMTKKDLEAKKAYEREIQQKKERDAKAEAEAKRKEMEEMLKNMPVRASKQSSSGAETIINMEDTDSEHESEATDLDPDIVIDNILPDLIQTFNEDIVVSEGCILLDGGIDLERVERDTTLSQAQAGLRLTRYVAEFINVGDRLVRDGRFQEVKLSLAWTCLVVAGDLVPDRNAFTDPARWANFRILFERSMEEGDAMDVDDRQRLDNAMKDLREYCVSITSVLCSTENNIACQLYVSAFDPSLVIVDEANRSLITDHLIAVAHMEPKQVFYVGDTKQLQPVVTGPAPLTGFLPELRVSAMAYFAQNGWPSVEIYVQRRAYAGVMDIPIKRFYHDFPINGPNSKSSKVFLYTKKVIRLIAKWFPDPEVQYFPSMYFEVVGSVTQIDPITKSRYNLQIASFVMNIVEPLVRNGIPPKHQGIVTPYKAQVMVYRHAINQLHLANPEKGYNRLLVGTTDSMEGEERPVMHIDTVVTTDLGFVDDSSRMLVMTTRAKDISLIHGDTTRIYEGRRPSDLVELFKSAKHPSRRICRWIMEDNKYRNHRFVQYIG